VSNDKTYTETALIEDLRVGSRVFANIYQVSGGPYALILQFKLPPKFNELIVAVKNDHCKSHPTKTIGVRVQYSEAVRSEDNIDDHNLKGEVTLRSYAEVYKELCSKEYRFGDIEDEDLNTKTKSLIRRNKPLLLWLKLAVKSSTYEQLDREIINEFVGAILRGNQSTNLLSVKEILELDDREKQSGQRFLLAAVKRICDVQGISSEQEIQVNGFYNQLEKIFKIKKNMGVDNDRDNQSPQKNPKVAKLMKTEAYQHLIERVEKIEKRVDLEKESENNPKNLLKADGILALEEAIERASLEPDDVKAYQIISSAIEKNQEAISAYAGWFSEEVFYFFTSNKSTSDGLLKEISAHFGQIFPEQNKLQVKPDIF
jgi:hypothetical protein